MEIVTTSPSVITDAMAATQKIFPAVSLNPIEVKGKTRDGRVRIKVTLKAKTGEEGAKRSASGGRLPKASWEAHRVFFEAVYKLDRNAVIKTAIITYTGFRDFLGKYHKTVH